MSFQDQFRRQFEQLESLHDALNKSASAMRFAKGYAVLGYTKEQEKMALLKKEVKHSVSEVPDEQAIHTMLQFLGKYKVDVSTATRFVRRIAGIIVLDSAHRDKGKIMGLCQQINTARNELLSLARNIKNKELRHEQVHNAVPGFMSEHAKRNIVLIDKPVKSIALNWATPAVPKKLTQEYVEANISDAIANASELGLNQEWRAKLDVIKGQIADNVYDAYQYYRDSTPKIVALMTFEDKTTKNTSMSSPWILCGQPNNFVPKLGTLTNYTGKVKKRDAYIKPEFERVRLHPTKPIYGQITK